VAKARAAGKGRALRRKSFGLRRRGLPSIADEELSMRQNRALATAVPPAGPEIIRHYHAHVYYDPVSSRGRAASLRERVAAAFPDATLGRWHDAPVGPACRIYERAGFKLVATKEHDEFGQTLVGETWELDLE
jgi:hypothetical protein